MAQMMLLVNGRKRIVDVAADTPLLWVLRDSLGLTGTKFGCGKARCGACTVLVDGEAVRSSLFDVSDAQGKRITTIEGLGGEREHPAQRAWTEEEVPHAVANALFALTGQRIRRLPFGTARGAGT